ncbi:MAG: glycosyltransferase [Gemmataceae bacterium]
MALPHLGEFGWDAHVLAVAAEDVEGFQDPDLVATLPADVPVTRVRAIPPQFTRKLGFGSLGLRSYWALKRAGTRLLQKKRFDLVYFSTTIFRAMSLGPLWKRRLGIPYVVDLQDPWVNDYYARSGDRPPGGRLKHGFAQWSARRAEPKALRAAAHIVTVSPAYPEMLRRHYPDLPESRFTVLPFGASERDRDLVKSRQFTHRIFDPADGRRHWTYLGRGGSDMVRSLRALFLALRQLRRDVPEVNRLRLHFVGTNYATGSNSQKTIEPIAQDMGLGDLVTEEPARIPYLQGLALLRSSDVSLIISSDDPGYSASKVYPCILAERPVLALVHKQSLAGHVIDQCRAGDVVGFSSEHTIEQIAERTVPILRRLLARPAAESPVIDWEAFCPYTAREMTRCQCAVFDEASQTESISRPALVEAGSL